MAWASFTCLAVMEDCQSVNCSFPICNPMHQMRSISRSYLLNQICAIIDNNNHSTTILHTWNYHSHRTYYFLLSNYFSECGHFLKLKILQAASGMMWGCYAQLCPVLLPLNPREFFFFFEKKYVLQTKFVLIILLHSLLQKTKCLIHACVRKNLTYIENIWTLIFMWWERKVDQWSSMNLSTTNMWFFHYKATIWHQSTTQTKRRNKNPNSIQKS